MSYAEKSEEELGTLFGNFISFINSEAQEATRQLGDEKKNEEEQAQAQRRHAEKAMNR